MLRWVQQNPVRLWFARIAAASVPPITFGIALTTGEHPPLHWVLAGVGTLFSYGNMIVQSMSLDRSNEERTGIIVDYVLAQLARQLTREGSGRIRCNVMLPDKEGTLWIDFYHGMEDAPDLELALKPLQGCAGQAFHEGRVIWTDVAELGEAGAREIWKLSPAQIALTRDIGAIISAPILEEGSAQPRGCLNVDSTASLSDAGFAEEEIRDLVFETAQVIGMVLEWHGGMA